MSENSSSADEPTTGQVATGDQAGSPPAEPEKAAPPAGANGLGAGNAASNGTAPGDGALTTPATPAPQSTAVPAAAAAPAPSRPVPTPRSAGEAAATTVDDGLQVPSPGPAAETPPPWQRMPGSEAPTVRTAPAEQSSSVGSLFDGPTAYIDPTPADANGAAAGRGAPGGSVVASVRRPRQAALQLKRLDPWSVLKLGLVLALVGFLIWMVAVGVLYGVLDGMGVWDRLNGTYNDLVSGETQTGSALISAGRVFGLAAVVGAINSLLFAVVMTIGAFVYNASTDLVGGIEITLSERD